MTEPLYRGRFAPSPTGPLHFGSLVAALGSFLDARARGGCWLVRMEDLDGAREVPGAADDILCTLEALGFEWDGAVEYQSRRREAYQAALDSLLDRGHAYPCACSRREVADAGTAGPEGPIYPGTCREGLLPGRKPRSFRLRTDGAAETFTDRVQGRVHQDVGCEIGDFVVRRADGFFAYQLAVVVDDAWQGITEVVRGADLLLSTPRQLHLHRLLGVPSPEYAHLPLVVDSEGRKLSKQTKALPVVRELPHRALAAAFRFLHQPLPPEEIGSLADFWQWASVSWDLSRIPAQIQAPLPAARHAGYGG